MSRWFRKSVIPFMLFCLPIASALAEAKEFRLGIISDKPVIKKVKGYGPLAKYVGKRLGEFGITAGKVVVANDLDDMLDKIRARTVDVVLESAFSTIKMTNSAGMIPKLLVWKHGVRDYRTVFFVRTESPIRNLSDLKGKTLALQDPESTSAYLIPMAELKNIGLTVLPLKEKKKKADVRSVFVKHEKNQLFWVTEKKADAAAFSTDDWDELTERERGLLRIIHESNPVLRYIASFHPALPVDVIDAISAILIEMEADPEGGKVLKREASRIKKFEALSDGDLQSLQYVQEMMNALR